MKKRPIDQMDLFGGKELPMDDKPNEKQKFLQELEEIGKQEPKANVEQTNNDWDKDDWKEQVLQMTEGENENLINKILEEEAEELKKLQEELEQDMEDGLLLEDEPYFIKDNKLHIVRYQEQIHPNIANLAKNIIDSKWKQNINPKNVIVNFTENEDKLFIYDSIICISEYGVRFRVVLDDILQKLNKITFND
jgi:signal recognition particle GTPase